MHDVVAALMGAKRSPRGVGAGALLVATLLGVALLNPRRALAADIRVAGSRCASTVHLVAHNDPLSRVLADLGRVLKFELSFESDSDPVVDIDVTRPPLDLVLQLAPSENVSVAQKRDARCPQRDAIEKIWVLPSGKGSAMRTAMGAPNAQQAREAEAQQQKTQAGIDLVMRAHGFPAGAVTPAQIK